MKRLYYAQRGMTLVEIIVVIVLISVIFGAVASGIISRGDTAKAELNIVKMENLRAALGQYRLKFNRYPEKLEHLVSGPPNAAQQGIISTRLAEEKDLNDVWGAPFIYRTENSGQSYSLSTYGSDGVPGGEGAKQDVTFRP